MLTTRDSETPSERRHRLGLQLLWLWVLVVVLYFCWEVATYRGLFAMLAEWQFERLGQDLPTFDFCLLALAFASPALLLVRLRRRARGDDRAAEEERSLGESLLFASQGFMHFLFGFATALGLAALGTLAWTLVLPDDDRAPVPLTPYAPAHQVQEGPTLFTGDLTYGRIASFGRGILFVRHTVLYAPLKPPGGGDGVVRYFVEFLPNERADIHVDGTISHRAGILVRGDMPGALLRLYRYLGYRIARHTYVLYASRTTLVWPYYMLAVQFAAAALLFLLLALWQRLHSRRLADDVAARRRSREAARDDAPGVAPGSPSPAV